MKGFSPPFLTLGVLLVAVCSGWAKPDQIRFRFRLPHEARFQMEAETLNRRDRSLRAWPEDGSTNSVEFENRVVLQLRSGDKLRGIIAGGKLELSRVIGSNVFILQAPDAATAIREAQRMADSPEVTASYPVVRRQVSLDGPYAYLPTDINFANAQWPLERRNGDGSSAGMDINVRAGWPWSTGAGVTIAVADTGVELTHVELAPRVVDAPHFNFVAQNTDAGPVSDVASAAHGTEVAGLIVAQRNNARMVGVAPGATLASWVIFTTNGLLASDEHLMDMYQYQSNLVSVQNHSWGNNGTIQEAPTLLEQIGISNAISFGRSGRGVIMVRSAGNDRSVGNNSNDDGYPSDPRVICVGAVRFDGRTSSYSEPGACLLVGAPSGDAGFSGLFTTDLIGTRGANQIGFFPPNQDLSDYVFDSLGFSGTSGAAPFISGICALMLSANPNLTYRDVQQILLLSARHFDPGDPDVVTNGAGLRVSHNDGFGVPDAGVAVSLARSWTNRPARTHAIVALTNHALIPDDGLRVRVSGPGVPPELASIRCLPSVGPHADTPTALLQLGDFAFGTNASGYNLTNKGALIQRDTNATFASKINLAAQVGAAFAVVYNFSSNTPTTGAPGGDQLTPMGATDFVPIPAVFIGHSDGEALKALFQTNNSALAQIHLNSTGYVFVVTNELSCEHVALRVSTDHPLRGDVRITLVSPAGTRSVMQRFNADVTPGPVDWTYFSTHHFYENSAGTWTACFSDEFAGAVGSVLNVTLDVSGVPIVDADNDGLDDVWEMTYFGNLKERARGDPDRDGYSNIREQVMGTNPNAPGVRFRLDLSRWDATLARLSWPGSSNYTYEISAGTNVTALTSVTNVPGRWPETEWFTPYNAPSWQFFRVRAVPLP